MKPFEATIRRIDEVLLPAVHLFALQHARMEQLPVTQRMTIKEQVKIATDPNADEAAKTHALSVISHFLFPEPKELSWDVPPEKVEALAMTSP